ncbi:MULTISPECIES: hypothetical protein [Bacillus]|uniref:Uncharacterized protein n=2 Tax=Bacillus TaxID=1386 RepID=A0A0M4FTR8_9BACI|nr:MULTISPECIES: hypothetical protein [Bacillus]ALC83147.1 hypothetical protein AM592_17410 [Bacillus gobiensis]MBP1082215.1 glucan phosphoethanolaminetransferase (alkaline phosphatase superfamily) [Bacillus capparidis]MED1096828.1 hypothetical protein [Bacillus capparidis]
MLSHEAFNYVRYEFVFFIIILIALFINIVFLKKKLDLINWFTVISISFICIVVSVLNLIMLGYASDELNLRMAECTYMFIAVVILAVINSAISYKK